MINFNKHLKEILYEHDFIVLPRVGAFIADFRIDESGESAKPYKTFVFNSLLSADENNKFFNYILSKETLPLSAIENQWNEYVGSLKSVTRDNKLVEIPGIGHFVKEDKLNFKFKEQINFYSRDDFADDVNSISPLGDSEKPLVNEIAAEEQSISLVSDELANNKNTTDEETINESFDSETIADTIKPIEDDTIESESFLEEVYEEEERSRSFWWWLLPLLVILGALATYWWINGTITDQDSDYEQTVLSDSTGIVDSTMVDESFDKVTSGGESNDITSSKQASNSEVENRPKPTTEGAFHVWAGLFRNKVNAEKLQQKLIRNDIPAEIQMVKNMRRIYIPVNTESEAKKMVKKIEQLTGDKAVYFEVD